MMFKVVLLAVAFTASVVLTDASNTKKIVCYHGTWSTYRHGLGQFGVEDIDPNLCTHYIYTFVGLTEDGENILVLDSWLDLPSGRDNFGKFIALKEKNPDLKLLLAIGGWNEGSRKYSNMANDPAKRAKFVANSVDFLLKYRFDGFDFDWEYPNARDSVNWAADVDNFSKLLKELKAALQPHGLLLSSAVSAVADKASIYYEIPKVCDYLDFVNVMTYDMHGGWDPTTGHNAPLFTGEGDENLDKDLAYTVDASIRYWLGAGCPPEKIIMGVPTYARTFKLANTNVHGVRAPASGTGIAGPFTLEPGFMGYNELCPELITNTWTKAYDDLAKVPYAFKGNDWVTYDDMESIALKTKYALEKQLGGIMVWSIEVDDFHGTCHGETFPLIKTIKKILNKENDDDVTTINPITTTKPVETTNNPVETTTKPVEITTVNPVETTTTKPVEATTENTNTENSEICREEGYVRDPKSCSRFYVCVLYTNDKFIPYVFSCPPNTLWNQDIIACDYPKNVDCQLL